MTAVGLRELNDTHFYEDPFDPEHLFPSVTTVTGECTNRPWLSPWSAKLTAEEAVDNLDTWLPVLHAMGRDAAVDLLKGAAKRRREEAADRGTWVHNIAEALVLGGHIPSYGPEVEPYVDVFIRWFCDFGPEVEMTEATVLNWTHDWAGTVDLVINLPWLNGGTRVLVDTKTGANLDDGMRIQVDTYRRGEKVLLPFGQLADMPKTDAAAVLHIRPEEYADVGGYKFIRVGDDGGVRYQRFLSMRAEYGHRQEAKRVKHFGTVIYPPRADGSQPSPRVEDLDGWEKARGALRKAGLHHLEDVAALTPAELLALPGVGPKTVDLILTRLAEADLTLRQEVA